MKKTENFVKTLILRIFEKSREIASKRISLKIFRENVTSFRSAETSRSFLMKIKSCQNFYFVKNARSVPSRKEDSKKSASRLPFEKDAAEKERSSVSTVFIILELKRHIFAELLASYIYVLHAAKLISRKNRKSSQLTDFYFAANCLPLKKQNAKERKEISKQLTKPKLEMLKTQREIKTELIVKHLKKRHCDWTKLPNVCKTLEPREQTLKKKQRE